MRKAIWSLKVGSKKDQESKDEKLKAGLEYVEKLKKEDKVVSVEQFEDRIEITLE